MRTLNSTFHSIKHKVANKVLADRLIRKRVTFKKLSLNNFKVGQVQIVDSMHNKRTPKLKQLN